MIHRREAVARVPKDIEPAKYAPFLCAGVTTFNAIRHMDVPKGEIVAVQGLGGLGHLALQYANKLGFNVVALSSGSDKEKFARELGANHYVDGKKDDPVKKLQELGGAALIVATAPNADAIAPLMLGLQPGGKLLVLSRKHRAIAVFRAYS
jgi:D-arabinose 1-dehydrogenase-like Zn-dependent alcohol dehydrogenase